VILVRRRTVVLVVAITAFGSQAAIAIQATPASAAITIGQSPPIDGSPTHCAIGPKLFDTFQFGEARGASYQVPAGGGVITSWTAQTTSGSLQEKLRVFNVLSVTSAIPAGESTVQTVTNVPATFPTRIPVKGGEWLGFASSGEADGCVYETTDAGFDQMGLAHGGSGTVGKPEAASLLDNRRLNVSAVLEPDANGDGFGDESQTAPKCGGQAATITSTADDETVRGTRKDDVIVALGGDDVVLGLAGDDVICGGKGTDVLRGQGGSDVLIGGAGRDKLVGGTGADRCAGGGGDDAGRACERGSEAA
jgi:Ca2+-binding RTX toxin-like protein